MKLKTEKKRSVSIKSFGNAKTENTLDEVKLVVHVENEEKIYVNTLVTDICLPLYDQAIEIGVGKYPHLQNLSLADSNVSNSPLKIDILIGCKDYWRFIGSKQVKGSTDPVAVETKLDYILSKPIEFYGGKNTEESVFSSHLMRVETSLTQKQTLKETFEAIYKEIPATDKIVNNETVLKEFEEKTIFK